EVELGELDLAVGPEVLVAIAAGDLEVPLYPGDHQQLLEQLRGLGQGVELPLAQAGGDEHVPGALRCRPDESGRLDLQETEVVETPTDGRGGPGTRPEVGSHSRPTQVEIAVLEPEPFVDVGAVVEHERQGLGRGEDLQLSGLDLD